MKSTKWLSSCLAALHATVLLPCIALSQETASEQVAQDQAAEEVVVTARRRDEALLDVPISIVSTGAEELAQSGVQSVNELSRVVPGFIFNEFEGGQQSTAQLRGLSSFAFQTHAPQSVGILIDDVVLDVIGQGINDFNDIQRIEVLRGPQGTLFGRNTTGGVVHIITRDPTDEFEAKISAGFGSYDETRWNGTINGPLSENWSARASVFTSNRDGHIENTFDGRKLESEQAAGINAKFLYRPNEVTSLKFTGTYIERQRQGITTSAGGGEPVVAILPEASDRIRELYEGIAGPENDKVIGIGFHPYDEKIAALSMAWNRTIGEFELTSISALRHWEFEFGEDRDYRTFTTPLEPRTPIRFYVPNDLWGWSQEVRLASPTGGRWEYVVGLFASGSDLFERRDFFFNVSPDPDPAAAVYLFLLGDQDTEHKDYAVFGETDFHLTDTVTLTAGGRWTYDTTDIALDATEAPFQIPGAGIGFGPLGELYIPLLESAFPGLQEKSISDSEPTWRAGLRWEPTSDLMFYTTVARGFKGPTLSALGALDPVKPELTTSYEVGAKASFWDNRVSTSLSVFHADITDMQTQAAHRIVTPFGVPISLYTLTNAAEARSQGVEFEFSVAATERLRFDLGFAYIDAKFVDYREAACYTGQPTDECITPPDPNPLDPTDDPLPIQDLSDASMPLVPKWSGNAAATYDFTLPFWNGPHFMRLDYTYRDEINWDLGLAPFTKSDSVGVVGLTLGLRSADERFELLATVKNLTDEFVVSDLSIATNNTLQARLAPEYQRTWGLTLNYRIK